MLLLAELTSDGALELPEGTLSSSLTAEGLLRLPAVKGKSIADELLAMLHKSYDWDKERDTLNEIDIDNVRIRLYFGCYGVQKQDDKD